MSDEFYPDEITRRSWALYESLKEWGTTRTDVTLIGGWAVFELVAEPHGVRSRDVDIVLHSEHAFEDFEKHRPSWHLVWRTKGRTHFKDLRFEDPASKEIVVDIFTSDHQIGAHYFGTEKGTNFKPEARGERFLPRLEFLLRDKIRTAPLRAGRAGAAEKMAKDLVDCYNLVNHNKAGKTPAELLQVLTASERSHARDLIPTCIQVRPEYEPELQSLARWLA